MEWYTTDMNDCSMDASIRRRWWSRLISSVASCSTILCVHTFCTYNAWRNGTMFNSTFHEYFKEVTARYPNNNDRLWTLTSIEEEEEEKSIHMVHQAIVVKMKYIHRLFTTFQKDSGQQVKPENKRCLAEWWLQNTTSTNQSRCLCSKCKWKCIYEYVNDNVSNVL
jgi:hypothetical protein